MSYSNRSTVQCLLAIVLLGQLLLAHDFLLKVCLYMTITKVFLLNGASTLDGDFDDDGGSCGFPQSSLRHAHTIKRTVAAQSGAVSASGVAMPDRASSRFNSPCRHMSC